MAQAVSIQPNQLNIKQKSYAIKWTTMTAWNSTDDILAEVERRVKEHAPKTAGAGPPPAPGRSAKSQALTAKTRRHAETSQGRMGQVKPTDYNPKADQDNKEGVEIEESPFAPMVPMIPAFVTATLMEGYKSDFIELCCWLTIGEIRRRAAADRDAVDAL
jgi:hypothetical protein